MLGALVGGWVLGALVGVRRNGTLMGGGMESGGWGD